VTLQEFYGLLERITQIRAPRIRLPASLAHLVASLTQWAAPYRGKAPAITHGDVDHARFFWFYDYSRAREELGLHCRPLIETLRDTVGWLRREVLPVHTSELPEVAYAVQAPEARAGRAKQALNR
jgi:hypothetical protein